MLSKNMSLSLFSLATMMSFSTGYANDSLKDSFKKHVIKNKDVHTGLVCGAIGCTFTAIRTQLLPSDKVAAEITYGQVLAGALFVASQVHDKINDDLSLKSSLTQGISTIAGFALPILTVNGIQFLMSLFPASKSEKG